MNPGILSSKRFLSTLSCLGLFTLHGCIFSPSLGEPSNNSSGGQDSGMVITIDMGSGDCGDTFCISGQCMNGQCICSGDGDCAQKERCEEGLCVEAPGLECASVSCEPGEMCIEGICVLDIDEPECINDEACGPNGACVAMTCIDLLTDPNHCGEEGVVCSKSGSVCVDGLCTCGDIPPSQGAAASRPIFTNANKFKTWPAAELVAYPNADRFVCADESVALNDCDDVIFNEDYPLDAPHFVAIGALEPAANAQGADRIALNMLDGRGESVGAPIIYEGNQNSGESRVLMFKVVPIDEFNFQLFVLWESRDGSNRQVKSYAISSSADMTAGLSIKANPFVWASSPDIVDFSVAPGLIPRAEMEPLVVIALPVIEALDDDISDGALSLRGIVLDSSIDEIFWITQRELEELGDLSQFVSGFGASFVMNEGTPEIHFVFADTTYYPGVRGQGRKPAGFSQVYYNRYAYKLELDGTQVNANLIPSSIKTVGETLVNNLALTGVFFDDRSVLPAPFTALWDSAEDNFVSLGWSRARAGLGDDTSTYTYCALPLDDSRSVEAGLGNPIDGAAVYDSEIVFEGADESYVHWVETELSELGGKNDMSQLKLAKLVTGKSPTLGVTRSISPLIRARRLSVVTGPHATGVLATMVDGNAQLFFVAGGDEPVCTP